MATVRAAIAAPPEYPSLTWQADINANHPGRPERHVRPADELAEKARASRSSSRARAPHDQNVAAGHGGR